MDWNALVGNYLSQQLTSSAEGQKLEQLKTETVQKKLEASQYQQLAPLTLKQKQAELQGQIDQAAIKTSLLPLQREMVRDALSGAALSGDIKSTGDNESDAEIARLTKQTKFAMANNPNEIPALMGTLTKAKREIYAAAADKRTLKLAEVTQGLAQKPLASILEEARRQPTDPYQAAITQYISQHPDANSEDLTEYLDNTFGLTPYQRAESTRHRADHQDALQKSDRDFQNKKLEYETTKEGQRLQREEAERHHLAEEKIQQEKVDETIEKNHDKAAATQHKEHQTYVDKRVEDLNKFNTDDRAGRGTPSKLRMLNTVKTITGNKPVTAKNVLDGITAGQGKDMPGVYTNQIHAIVAVNAALSKDFSNQGQKTVKDILAKEYVGSIPRRTYDKLDAWILGQGNPELNNPKEAEIYAKMTAIRYNLAEKEVADGQIGKIQPIFTRPGVPPEMVSNTVRNVLGDPRNVAPTKAATVQALGENLHRNGVELTTEDDAAFRKAVLGFASGQIRGADMPIVAEGLIKTYEKYVGQLPHTPATANPPPPPDPGGVMHGYKDPVNRQGRENTRMAVLRDEQADLEERIASASGEMKAALERNYAELLKEMRKR